MKIASHEASVMEKFEKVPAFSSSKPIWIGMAMMVATTRIAMAISHLVLKSDRGSITHACSKGAIANNQYRDLPTNARTYTSYLD